MIKKTKIFETKLEQFVGEGYDVEDLKIITKEIELDTTPKQISISDNTKQNAQKRTGGEIDQKDEENALSSNKKILLLHNDGTNTEVMLQIQRIIDWMNKARYVSFVVMENSRADKHDDKESCIIIGKTFTEALDNFVLCLRQSFELLEEAYLIENAVRAVKESGYRTADIMETGMILVSCEKMCAAVITELKLMEQGFCLE